MNTSRNQIKRRSLKYCLATVAAVPLLSSLFSFTAIAAENEFAGEKVVHLLQEPRHRTVHQDGDLYLLDVQVNPGDTSFAHIHDQAILLTFISRGDGPAGGSVSSNIDYATEALTHKVSNRGPGLLRIMAMVNAGSGDQNLDSDRPDGFSAEPQLENSWFRSYKVELEPGQATSMKTHELASVVVQIEDGLIHVTRDDGVTSELDEMAKWAWHSAGESYSIRNVGDVATAVVVNEGRN